MGKKRSLDDVLKGVLSFHSETGTEGGYWAFQDRDFISKISPQYGLYADQTVWDANAPLRKGKTLDKSEVFLEGKWLPLPDPMQRDLDYVASSLFQGERRGNREADKRLMKKYGFRIKYSADIMDERFGKGNWHLEDSLTAVTPDGTRWMYGGTPSTEPQRPYGVPENGLTRTTVKWADGLIEQERLSNTLLVVSWSYEGLHVLANGDKLTIYLPDKYGRCKKKVWSGVINLKQYGSFTEHASGLWIHADQIGIKRDVWAEYFFKEYPASLILAKERKPKKT